MNDLFIFSRFILIGVLFVIALCYNIATMAGYLGVRDRVWNTIYTVSSLPCWGRQGTKYLHVGSHVLMLDQMKLKADDGNRSEARPVVATNNRWK